MKKLSFTTRDNEITIRTNALETLLSFLAHWLPTKLVFPCSFNIYIYNENVNHSAKLSSFIEIILTTSLEIMHNIFLIIIMLFDKLRANGLRILL